MRGAAKWLHDQIPMDRFADVRTDLRLVEAARRLGSDSLMLGVFPAERPGAAIVRWIGLRPR